MPAVDVAYIPTDPKILSVLVILPTGISNSFNVHTFLLRDGQLSTIFERGDMVVRMLLTPSPRIQYFQLPPPSPESQQRAH